jgi:hypothetical protein
MCTHTQISHFITYLFILLSIYNSHIAFEHNRKLIFSHRYGISSGGLPFYIIFLFTIHVTDISNIKIMNNTSAKLQISCNYS